MASDHPRANLKPLSLHVPEPKFRPGDAVDFAAVDIPAAGAARRPDTADDARASPIWPIRWSACSTRRSRGRAVGPEAQPRYAAPDAPQHGAGPRVRRAHVPRAAPGQDQLLHEVHRRGGGRDRRRHGARPRRHVLPDLSPAGPADRARLSAGRHDEPDLFERGATRCKGRQLPIMYSAQGRRLLLDLAATSRTQYPQAVGWAMASARQGRHADRRGLDRRRLDRRGRLPLRADLRRGLSRAGDPQRRQQPVGDLELPGHRRRRERPPSRRAAIGYGIAGAARRRQRLPGGLCGDRNGRPSARATNLGPDADRAFHLPRRGPFDLRRSDRNTAPPTSRAPGRSAIRSRG